MTKAESKRKMTLADAYNAVVKLEKENQDLRDNYDQLKATAEPEIERLKKENAELKLKLKEIEESDSVTELKFLRNASKSAERDVRNAYKSGKLEGMTQLTTAKEIIRSSVVLLTKPRTALDTKTYLIKAEQFLKEIEK